MYTNANLQIKINRDFSNIINVIERELQGELFNALMFCLVNNDILCYKGLWFEHWWIQGYKHILILTYAVDIIIFADSPIDVQRKLGILEFYCTHNTLTINVEKNKVILLHNGRKWEESKVNYCNQELKNVSKFNYLWVLYSASGLFREAAIHRVKKTMMAIYQVKSILCKAKSKGTHEKINYWTPQ